MNKPLDRWSSSEIAFRRFAIGSGYDSSEWCRYEDVEQLQVLNAELLETAEKVAERFDTDMVERLFFINKVKAFDLAMAVENLRAAIAKAKGEQP